MAKKGMDLAIILGGPRLKKGKKPPMKSAIEDDEDMDMDMEEDEDIGLDEDLDGAMAEIQEEAAALFDGDEEKGAALVSILEKLMAI